MSHNARPWPHLGSELNVNRIKFFSDCLKNPVSYFVSQIKMC